MDKCPTCGAGVRPGDNFCLTCGNRLFPEGGGVGTDLASVRRSQGSPLPPLPTQQPSSTPDDATVPAQDWPAPNAPAPVYDGWSDVSDKTIPATVSSSELPTVRADASVIAAQPEPKKIEYPARFVIRAPNGDVLQDYLLEKPDIVIGRIPEYDINFPDDMLVSRKHATVHYKDSHYVLRDQGSANGTLVNNQQLVSMTDWTLQDGDTILIGDHELIFKSSTPIEPGMEESETIIMPLDQAPQVDDERTVMAGDVLGTQTMDVADLGLPADLARATTRVPTPLNATPAPTLPESAPSAAPLSSPPSVTPEPKPEVTVGSFSRLSQPSLPDVDALLTASTALNEQIASLQQQLRATQEAMGNHEAEVAQTADRLRIALRHLAERMDSAIAGVARSRGEMDWDGLQRVLQDVISSPRDIGYVTAFAYKAPEVDKTFQRYQGVLNTLAECNSLLRGIIGEEKP